MNVTHGGWPVPRSVWWIAAACILPEIVLAGADLGLWGHRSWRLLAYQYGGFWPGLLDNWQPNYALQPWAMFVTYGFLHGGLGHLAMNMLTLVIVAGPLAARIGRKAFLGVYALSLVGGGLGYAALATVPAPMVGASGALFGLVGALLALDFDQRIARGLPVRNVLTMIAGIAVANAAYWWGMGGGLAWQAHLGGFVAGWLYIVFAGPDRVR